MKKEINENKALSQTAVSGSVILPTDIRIGNWVNADPYGNYKIIALTIFPNGSQSAFKSMEYYPQASAINRLKPISISEELLLKIGAEKLDFKEYPSFNLRGVQINFINELWIEYVSRIEITGLHHLQNIFYFRMAEELEVPDLTDSSLTDR